MTDDASPPGFDVLYEQGPCLVVNKPGGVLTQAPPYLDSLEERIKSFLKQRERKSGRIYLGMPHRLDRPVSGAVVVARHVRAARRLSDQFQRRTVEKTYWALLEGCIEENTGTLEDFVRKIPDLPQAELVDADHPGARRAVLHYRVLSRTESTSWLEIRLETGRMHQIRVQWAARGHSVVGDAQYGAGTSFGPVFDDPRARWIALHARSVGFEHPMTRAAVSVTAPLPPIWNQAVG